MSRRTKSLLPTTRELLKPKPVDVERERAAMAKRQENQAKYFNQRVKDLKPLTEGDVVRMQPFRKGKKVWEKGVVTERLDERSYAVETAKGGVYRRNRYHLRKTQECPDTPLVPSDISQNDTQHVQAEVPCSTAERPESPHKPKHVPRDDHPVQVSTRPVRQRKPPAWLKDFVTK